MELADIPITEVMSELVDTVTTETTLDAVFQLFSREGCTDLVVVDVEGKYAGVITALTLVAAVGPIVGIRSMKKTNCLECLLKGDATCAGDIMTHQHITIGHDASLADAIRAMEKIRHPDLIVVDQDGFVMGKVEVCTIISHLRVIGHL